MNQDTMLSIYQFNAQANRVVLAEAAQVSAEDLVREFSPSHGTVLALLVHILGGETFFPAVCQGHTPDMTAVEAVRTFDEVRALFEITSAASLAYVESSSDAELAREVTLTFGDYTFRLPVWQVLLQQVFHAHMHRGELSILLSELGHPLPTIDLLVHFIQQSGQEWPF
jgi:uncharacterized damage-inducible protein DinB